MKKTLGQICQELLHPDPVEGIHFLNKASRLMRGQTMIPLDLTTHLKLATEAKERAAKATEGPWVVDRYYMIYPTEIPMHPPCIAQIFKFDTSPGADNFEPKANAILVAHARTDVPTLADAVIQLVKEVERLKEENIAVRIREAGA